jgi:hypothetical protein
MTKNIIYKEKYIIKNNKVIKKENICFKCGTSEDIIPSGYCVDCEIENNEAQLKFNVERDAYLELMTQDLIKELEDPVYWLREKKLLSF